MCSPSVSSVHTIFQVRILEWVAMPFSGGSSQPRVGTHVSYVPCIGRHILFSIHGSRQSLICFCIELKFNYMIYTWCLAPFTQHDAFKAHLCCSMYKKKSMHLYFWVVFHCMDTAHFVYPFTCWWTFGVFPALLAVVNKGTSYKYLFTGICENMCLLLLGKYLGEEYLGHMIGRGLPV